jgi:nicotinamide-nucleotide adenylyltransferase
VRLTTIAARIEALSAAPGFAVDRFDAGPPLAGRVAVLPSAFNPPTLAHALLLEIAATTEGVSASAALLTTRNVDKGLYGATLAHRVGMLLALVRRRPGRAVLSSNAARFIDQAAALRQAQPGVGFDFVAGYDTLVRIFDSRYYGPGEMAPALDAFFGAHRLLVTNRADADVVKVRAYLEASPAREFAARIIVREIPPEPALISSTRAREEAASRRAPRSVPEPVRRYILRHGLYVPDTPEGRAGAPAARLPDAG